jgi:hypothetical protein
MRNRSFRSSIEQRIAQHVRQGEPIPLASASAAAMARVLVSRAAPQPGRTPLFHLCDTHITGALELKHASVGIPLVFENCTFDEPVTIRDSEVKDLEFRSCALPAFDGRALRVAGDLTFTDTRVGSIDLFGAQVGGHLWLTGSHVESSKPDACAINAPSIQVAGGLYAWRLTAVGGINLWGAEIGAGLELHGSTVSNADRVALRAPALAVQLDVNITSCRIEGGIDLFGARVGGQLWLNGSHVDGSATGYGISAPQIEVAGGCYARGLTVRGGVNLWGAVIRAGLELDDATLVAKDRPALRAPKLTVTGDVTLGDGATVMGAVDFSSATVDGCLLLKYRVEDDHKLSVSDCHVKTLHLEILPSEHVRVGLNGAVVTSLVDTQESWPRILKLDRMKYETLRPLLPARERLLWLGRNQDSDSPQPYEQLAQQYREVGHDHDARTVLLAKYRNRTRRLPFPLKLWGYLQDITVGYGYRPVRALAWLAGLMLAVSVSSVVWQPRPTTSSAAAFSPIAYALDVVLPILDLGQEKAYSAVSFGRIVVWIAILAGWILASTVIASVTRSVSRS